MTIPIYSRVRLITDRYKDEGASKGDIGYIIEIYENRYFEVEFSGADGIDYAQVVVEEEEIEIYDETA
jgi:hypothetical protein